MALASTEKPSGASTKTRQVMSNDLEESPAAVFDTTDLEVLVVPVEVDALSLCSKCNKV